MAVQRGLTDALRTPPIPKETPDEDDRVRGGAEAITVASGLNKESRPEAGHARLASAGRPA
jgi:hypothetical protein